MLTPHSTGKSAAFVNRLSEEDEKRYNELLSKHNTGTELNGFEQRDLQELLDKKFPNGYRGSLRNGYPTSYSDHNIRNGQLAGKNHPITGVPFDEDGFPDFTNYLYNGGINDVKIYPTHNRTLDESAAPSS